jgi:hypothetical protein
MALANESDAGLADEEEDQQRQPAPPVINRDIARNPLIPSAPADAAPTEFERPGSVPAQQPGPIAPPARVPPKPPVPLTADRQQNVALRQQRAGENYQEQRTRFDAGLMYDKQQAALREQKRQQTVERAQESTAYAAQEQEKSVINTETRNTLRGERVETEQDPDTGLVRPARDERGNLKFKAGQDEQVAVDKQLHAAGRDALGEDVYSSALNLRQLQTTAATKQGDLKKLREEAAGLEAKAGETQGGFLGIGKSPTPAAQAAQARLAEINPQIDELQKSGYGRLTARGGLAEPDEVAAARKAHGRLTADKSAWSQLSIKDAGQLDDALDERKASILEAGGDPEKDRVVQAISERKKELGIVDKPENPEEKALRSDPNYGPILRNRDTLDAQVKPLEKLTNKLLSRLEDAVGFQTNKTVSDQGDPDARLRMLQPFIDKVTDPAQAGKVRTLLNALQPALGHMRQTKEQRDFLQGQINLQTRPAPAPEPQDATQQQFHQQLAEVSATDPRAAASAIKEEISAAPDRPIHDVVQKIKGFFYPLFGPNEEQQQHVYNSILKDGPSQYGLIPSLNGYVSNVSSAPNLIRAMALKAEGKDVTLDSIADYKNRERQAAGLTPSKGDSKPWAVTKGVANSLIERSGGDR